jgi:hypothetical protein
MKETSCLLRPPRHGNDGSNMNVNSGHQAASSGIAPPHTAASMDNNRNHPCRVETQRTCKNVKLRQTQIDADQCQRNKPSEQWHPSKC